MSQATAAWCAARHSHYRLLRPPRRQFVDGVNGLLDEEQADWQTGDAPPL